MDYAEAYDGYAAQGILRIDVEIVRDSHPRRNYNILGLGYPAGPVSLFEYPRNYAVNDKLS